MVYIVNFLKCIQINSSRHPGETLIWTNKIYEIYEKAQVHNRLESTEIFVFLVSLRVEFWFDIKKIKTIYNQMKHL